MQSSARLVVIAALLSLAALAPTTVAQDAKATAGAISGKVTVDGKPARGVTIIAEPAGETPSASEGTTKLAARTDETGHYKLIDVPAGKYEVRPVARVLVPQGDDDLMDRHLDVAVGENQAVEDIDFALVRGGVITGRVTDASGKPVIADVIHLSRLNEENNKEPVLLDLVKPFETDDRGVYRVYGLQPGRYIVGAGGGSAERLGPISGRRNHPRVYYPGATDDSKAKPVEVAAGAELTGIDITVGAPNKGFELTGRLSDAHSGLPVTGAIVTINPTKQDSGATVGFSMVDTKGRFTFESVLPGEYTAEVSFTKANDYSKESLDFEIKDQAIDPLEIKLHHGASISGVVTFDPGGGPGLVTPLEASISAYVQTDPVLSGRLLNFMGDGRSAPIAADGTFLVNGLKPGKLAIGIEGHGASEGLRILRVERAGVPQNDGIEIREAEVVADVRVIVVQGTGVIRGQVTLEGMKTLVGVSLVVYARSLEDSGLAENRPSEVDSNGTFVIEHLMPGKYELRLTGFLKPSSPGDLQGIREIKQAVEVTSGATATVAFTIPRNQQQDK